MKKNFSAIKRNQISLRNRDRNKKYKTSVKTSIKKYLLSLENNNYICSDFNVQYLSIVYQRIDKAVKTGIIHKNKAARKKSRLAKLMKVSS
uniref:Ribosomal protein S20 n=1 Tax=Sphondylothamnion multifidum TaxID=193186 RepID=A0A4D6X167_9FLOR|nr:ribosomal protein S20 [Sphondylothamnion multifidum]